MRVEIEAAIDFPDEGIEILEQAQVAQALAALIDDAMELLGQAEQGRKLSQGMTIALVGEPNVGKSSLLNALSGEEAAVVTEIPGTTRDLLKVDVVIDGIPLRLVDTAGLRRRCRGTHWCPKSPRADKERRLGCHRYLGGHVALPVLGRYLQTLYCKL